MGICFSDSKCRSSSLDANICSTQIEELCCNFSLAEIRKSTTNFHQSRVIGRGEFNIVYKGFIEDGAKEIAIKRLESNTSYGLSLFRTEIELLCQLRHPNLVSLVGFCNEKDEKIIAYEYMHNGTFVDHLLGNTREPLPWKRRLEICIGAAHGLHYLHTGAKRTIFHRDVKPGNILLDQNWTPKLLNLGQSIRGPLSASKSTPLTDGNLIGTIGYLAPDYLINKSYTEKCDIFSFGVVLLVVVCGKDPVYIVEICRDVNESGSKRKHLEGSSWQDLDLQLYDIVKKGMTEEIIDPFLIGKIAPQSWKVFMDIAERCLLFEPNERPTIGEVEMELEHALALQEEADAFNPIGDSSLLSI